MSNSCMTSSLSKQKASRGTKIDFRSFICELYTQLLFKSFNLYILQCGELPTCMYKDDVFY